ncbi:bicaudal D-related protein homolog [Bradysia coprophila]|uniref:bicaudal D-related protein homolog n=1 Tax=Bradysia coprophila TaxID=38358 RepID=UPI00187D77A9|nr:bicaudal D-related protein homolog [Bradysia coprophila]
MAKTKPTLEDYIFDMETRPPERSVDDADEHMMTEQDVWQKLQKKEADLVLAAELGKALLEKNEELTKQQEKLIEEYSTKLERLEQEKHILRRKLSEAESEGDIRAQELESDYNEIKSKMLAQETSIRQNEREKNLLIEELTAQNARLTQQLQAATQNETQLQTKLQDIKDQYSIQHSSLQNHVNGVESLRDELDMLVKSKEDLEKRLQTSLVEKDTLIASLDESRDRIHSLQKQLRDQEMKMQTTIKNLERVQRENDTLSERLESGTNGERGLSSLQNEMDCDDEFSESQFDHSHPLFKEARSVYNQLKQLLLTLQNNQDGDSGLHSDLFLGSTCQSVGDDLRQGMLASVADDVINAIMGLDVVHIKTMLDESRTNGMDQDEELRRRQDLIAELEGKLSVIEIELQSAIEERNRARQDASESNLAQDEVVVQARNDRDAATARRTKAEVELAKNRVELMQANSELLEAIQQKVELSEQLEQWQMDMHELIEEHMKKQLHDSLAMKESPVTSVTKKPNRFMGLFQQFQFQR